MFGKSKPVTFEPYGRRRSRGLLPRWLVLLLIGIAIGAGGVLYIQERYLPPRLSAEASQRLHTAFDQADSERSRLKGELEAVTQRLESALADKKEAVEAQTDNRDSIARLRADLQAVVAALPPDPRGGEIQVRAASFAADAGTLDYDVVLSREAAGDKQFTGVMQLVVAGENSRGTATTTTLEPIAIAMKGYESLRGSAPLPEGFKPQQTTVRVLDRTGGKLLGMRVLYVK